MAKKDKQKKSFKDGYVSFSPEDLKQQAVNDAPNGKAYELLDEAMTTSSHVSINDKKRGSVDVDDVYPITAAETQDMEDLLDKAEAAANNPNDPDFKGRLNELRNIVEWSKKRHWNFQWMVIIGVLISVFVLSKCSGSEEENVRKYEAYVATVENWKQPAVDTTISIKKFDEYSHSYSLDYRSANLYKAAQLQKTAYFHYSSLKTADNYRHRADTATTSERKESYIKHAENSVEAAEKYKKEYDKLNKASFEDVHEMALDEVEEYLSRAKSSARWIYFWNMFFLILIPVYIFAERPYGYSISKYRTEAKVLKGIKKGGLALAGALVAWAGSIGFVDVVTKWSDGSTTREDDGTGGVRIALKIGLLIAALFVICVVSCFLMLYSTITGLIRNYDWKAVAATVKKK
ncbi:MAG: hypothetical protein LBM07_07295 [Culturomica sp.]|jgi:hypothetical protein|nr:hypothetical protein [Culturomica sp.]